MNKYKTISLCADDFGQNAGISAGILQLVTMRRLSAVSCMVNMPDFSIRAKELQVFKEHIQSGLHFNLSEGFFLSQPGRACFGLNELLIKTHLRLLPTKMIENELHAQLDCYIEAMGTMPDFIDGHQHVHQFPQIRSALLKCYEQRLKSYGITIRSTYPAVTLAAYQRKASILAVTGGKALGSQLIKANIPHNHFFSGVYDFAQQTDYRVLFRQWLARVASGTLIMCHPGIADATPDPIAHTRLSEFNYLRSNEFMADCHEYQVSLTTSPKTREAKIIDGNQT